MTGKSRMRLILITGARNSGKTALVRLAAAELRGAGGVCSPAELRGGAKTSYFVRSLRSGRRLPLLRVTDAGPKTSEAGFRFACSVIRRNASRKVLFVDEYGPLESRGIGFYPALLAACARGRGVLVLTARKSLLGDAAAHLGFKRYKVLDLDNMDGEIALKCLLKYAA